MRVIGADLSLTATGIALPDGTTLVLSPPDRPRKRGEHRTAADNLARLDWLTHTIINLLDAYTPELAVIEGYSMASATGREEAGELGGAIRLACWRMGIGMPTVTGKKRTSIGVPPILLKQFACGDSRADKPKMTVRARDAGWTGDDHNQADSFWLRQMGLYAVCRASAVPPTAYRDEAVAKVGWPTVDTEVSA